MRIGFTHSQTRDWRGIEHLPHAQPDRTPACQPPRAIVDVNSREVGLDLAHEWARSIVYTSFSGPWSIKVVNELDRCSQDEGTFQK